MRFLFRLIPSLLLLSAAAVQAQTDHSLRMEDLSWMDRNQMAQQVEYIDQLARTRLGTQVRGDLTDLALLQRIVDQQLIAEDDTFNQQGMGVVLGHVLVNEVRQLHWQVYEDEEGRSRAVCVQGTQECAFPVTMLSRRIALGMRPDVQRLYDKALKSVEHRLPKLPYGASRSSD